MAKINISKSDFLHICLLALREKIENEAEEFLPDAIEAEDILHRFVNAKQALHFHWLNVDPDLRKKWNMIKRDFLVPGNVILSTTQKQKAESKINTCEKYLLGENYNT